MARYVFLRLSVTEQLQPDIFADTQPPTSRTDHLVAMFRQRWDFIHRRQPLVYLPMEIVRAADGDFCHGRIGKRSIDTIVAGPEENFREETQETWRVMDVVLDTRDFPDGQKLAVQDLNDVGKPLPIISSLLEAVNFENRASGWEISAEFVVTPQTFWQAVSENDGRITQAEFTYHVPNVLGIRSKLTERLREYKQRENANEAKVKLSNDNGRLRLSEDNEELRDAVEYISEGGGSAKLRAGSELVYDSSNPDRPAEIEIEEAEDRSDSEVRRSRTLRIFL